MLNAWELGTVIFRIIFTPFNEFKTIVVSNANKAYVYGSFQRIRKIIEIKIFFEA